MEGGPIDDKMCWRIMKDHGGFVSDDRDSRINQSMLKTITFTHALGGSPLKVKILLGCGE